MFPAVFFPSPETAPAQRLYVWLPAAHKPSPHTPSGNRPAYIRKMILNSPKNLIILHSKNGYCILIEGIFYSSSQPFPDPPLPHASSPALPPFLFYNRKLPTNLLFIDSFFNFYYNRSRSVFQLKGRRNETFYPVSISSAFLTFLSSSDSSSSAGSLSSAGFPPPPVRC